MLLRMRKEFVDENSKRKYEKDNRDNQYKTDCQHFKVDFFPFTHGDSIEIKRRKRKDELNEVYTQICL